MLDGLVEAVRAGESRVLVVRGEPGVSKTALLDHLARQASGCRVVRTAGVQSEMELAFAGRRGPLHLGRRGSRIRRPHHKLVGWRLQNHIENTRKSLNSQNGGKGRMS